MTLEPPDVVANREVAAASAPASLGRDVTVYGLGLAVGQVISALTTPFFTRALGPRDFGSLELLTVAATLMTTIILAGCDLAAIRLYYASDTTDRRRAVVWTGLITVCTVGVLSVAAIWPFAGPLARLVFRRGGEAGTLRIAAISLPFTVAATYTIELLRVQRRPWAFMVSGLLRSAVGGLIGAALVLATTLDVQGVFVGVLVGGAAAFGFNVWAARALIRPVLSRRVLRGMLAYGLPLVPAGLAAWSMMLADRVVLARYANLGTVGFYAVANRIANLMLLAVFGFRAGWAPFSLELHHRDAASERRKRAQVLTDVLAGVSLLAVLLGALSRELVVIVAGPRYLEATDSIPVLVIALVLFSTVPVTQLAMMIKHRTRDIALHSAIAAAVNVVACFVLIPRWGLMGAALANLAGFGYQAISYYLRAQRLDRVPYDLRRAGVIVGLALPYLLLGPTAIGPLWSSTLIKLVAVVTYPAALVRLGYLDLSAVRAGLRTARAGVGRAVRSAGE